MPDLVRRVCSYGGPVGCPMRRGRWLVVAHSVWPRVPWESAGKRRFWLRRSALRSARRLNNAATRLGIPFRYRVERAR